MDPRWSLGSTRQHSEPVGRRGNVRHQDTLQLLPFLPTMSNRVIPQQQETSSFDDGEMLLNV